MANEFMILKVQPYPASDPARAGKQDTAVLYQVGNDVRRVRIPKDYPASEKDILAAVREVEKGIHPIQGKSYPLQP